jgi:DNA-binding NarL/FixJ family response regulator
LGDVTHVRLEPIRVLLADVDGRPRRALASLISGLERVTLAGEVGDPAELAAALLATRADVLLIDDRLLRNRDGDLPTNLRVIVVGVDDDPAFSARARRLGAEAWVAKDRAGDELPALLGS